MIENYFKYRFDQNKIDHGISASLLLYDRIMKIHAKTSGGSGFNTGRFNLMKFNTISKSRQKHYMIIARTIALHNMWRANVETKEIFKEYGLNDLIPDKANNHILKYEEEHNLLFILGLVDTIDPVKFYQKKDVEVTSILNSIQIDSDYKKRVLTIKCNNFHEEYTQNIKGLSQWIDVDVKREANNEIIVNLSGIKKEKATVKTISKENNVLFTEDNYIQAL